MYLSYGDSLNIFPDEKSKNILLKKINVLKNKIENGENCGKGDEKK